MIFTGNGAITKTGPEVSFIPQYHSQQKRKQPTSDEIVLKRKQNPSKKMCLSATDPSFEEQQTHQSTSSLKVKQKTTSWIILTGCQAKYAICDGFLWLALGGLTQEHANFFFFLLMRLRNFRHNIFHALLVANSPLNSKCTANQYLHQFQQFSFLLNHTSVSHYSHFYFGRENDILHSTQGVLYRNDTSVMQSLLLKGSFLSKPVPTN